MVCMLGHAGFYLGHHQDCTLLSPTPPSNNYTDVEDKGARLWLEVLRDKQGTP